WLVVLFALGSILSVLNIPPEAASNATDRAISVLPNYIYWCILIVVMVAQRRLINWKVVYKAVFWGVMMTVLYYFFFQHILESLPFFNAMTPNAFAFLTICFTPMAVHHLKSQKGRIWATIFFTLLVFALLIDGRRAGMVLVFLSGIGVLYADRINWKRILLAAALIPFAMALFYTKQVEALVFQSSERIHEMIYQSNKIQKEDRSYLTRVAMVKKGLAIFEQYPYNGIGLNNFTNISVDFDKSFEGAKYVVNKADVQRTSAHNSYINVLAEGGLLLFIPLVLLLALNIIHFIRHYNTIQDYLPVYLGLVGMSIHLYFISAIVNVFAWFLIGLACAATSSFRKR
ncbi:MAG TPA: O-antigen ligase family protein, partial [Chitinophagaceae bacterium]|nr:O-antigen ligase family protein [Chitinophagaceae bacterium]